MTDLKVSEVLIYNWFVKRFKRFPSDDESYYSEWKERFSTNIVVNYMDSESRKC